ncbi:KLHL9_13 [Acanthosepion pharaonis]|uniref:KLHL9_13 n=1 Tax=Acanthosepion pharaonis TaxID=158019 RepID=A0A812BU48_ACAPH|nr:KLHL9_13 [Sepia pharaonis]
MSFLLNHFKIHIFVTFVNCNKVEYCGGRCAHCRAEEWLSFYFSGSALFQCTCTYKRQCLWIFKDSTITSIMLNFHPVNIACVAMEVTLTSADGKSVCCNADILARHSEYIAAMLRSRMSESKSLQVKFEYLSLEQLRWIRDYVGHSAKDDRPILTFDNAASVLKPAPVPLIECGSCTMDNILYVAGGQSRYTITGKFAKKTVYRYIPYRKLWQQVAAMNEYRCLFYLGVLNNCLYAVGGINWTGVLGSVEVYHCDQDVWQRDTDLPYLVHEHADSEAVSPSSDDGYFLVCIIFFLRFSK